MDHITYLKLFTSSLFLSTHRIKKIFNLLNVQLIPPWAIVTTWVLAASGSCVVLELCLLPSCPTRTAQQPSTAMSLHAGFVCLPFSSSSFHFPLSLFLNFATASMEKESWKQIDLVCVLMCLECMGGKGVAFLGSVSPKQFYISLSKGLKGPSFYIAGNRLTKSADCFML